MNEAIKIVSIITINFNHPEVTEALLASIFSKNRYSYIEIIVVDNGSSINPVPGWVLKYPTVTFIRSEINTGFAGGNNIGLGQAKGDYLFLINNDTEVTESLVGELVHTLDANPKAGMVSPKIHYYQEPGVLQYAGYTSMNYYTARNACIGQFEKDTGQYDHLSGITAYAHGAAMMVRREAVERAGLMDERYFLYYEELDWCEMIKRAGYIILVNMHALIYHKESVSVGSKSAMKEYYMNRNRILFIRRNAGIFQKWVFIVYFMIVVVPRNIFLYCRAGEFGFIKQLFLAVRWNFFHKAKSS